MKGFWGAFKAIWWFVVLPTYAGCVALPVRSNQTCFVVVLIIKAIFIWPWKQTGFGKCSLFVLSANGWKRSKHGLYVFLPKKTLIWRGHCLIGQSCCSRTSRWSINWYLESSQEWSFFTKHSLNQPKAMCVCIRSINQSNCSISIWSSFLFCLSIFISRSNKNCSNKIIKTFYIACVP